MKRASPPKHQADSRSHKGVQIPRGIPVPPSGVTAERESWGDAFARARVAYAFPERPYAEQQEIVHDLRASVRRPRSMALPLMGYAHGLATTVGFTTAEGHTLFLELGWAQRDQRDWARSTQRAILAQQQRLVDLGGAPSPIHRRERPAVAQRISRPNLGLTVSHDEREVNIVAVPTVQFEAERRGEERAVQVAMSRLRGLAEPHWVVDLLFRPCRLSHWRKKWCAHCEGTGIRGHGACPTCYGIGRVNEPGETRRGQHACLVRVAVEAEVARLQPRRDAA